MRTLDATLAATLVLGALQGAAQPAPSPSPAGAVSAPLKGAKLTVTRVKLRQPVSMTDESGATRPVQTMHELRITAAEAIPVRALDPILHVGDASVREYRYADKDRTLVFTLVDDKLLREDAEVFLQFGDDTQSRTPLARFKRTQVREVTR